MTLFRNITSCTYPHIRFEVQLCYSCQNSYSLWGTALLLMPEFLFALRYSSVTHARILIRFEVQLCYSCQNSYSLGGTALLLMPEFLFALRYSSVLINSKQLIRRRTQKRRNDVLFVRFYCCIQDVHTTGEYQPSGRSPAVGPQFPQVGPLTSIHRRTHLTTTTGLNATINWQREGQVERVSSGWRRQNSPSSHCHCGHTTTETTLQSQSLPAARSLPSLSSRQPQCEFW